MLSILMSILVEALLHHANFLPRHCMSGVGNYHLSSHLKRVCRIRVVNSSLELFVVAEVILGRDGHLEGLNPEGLHPFPIFMISVNLLPMDVLTWELLFVHRLHTDIVCLFLLHQRGELEWLGSGPGLGKGRSILDIS